MKVAIKKRMKNYFAQATFPEKIKIYIEVLELSKIEKNGNAIQRQSQNLKSQ